MNNKYLHLTKGVHIVFPHYKLPIKQSVYFDVEGGRMIFAIPRGRCTYVGTTDTNYSGDLEHVVATKADAKYLLNAINHSFPNVNLSFEDIESNWAGLRPLIHEEDKDPSALSRKEEIFISESGLISIAGGKLTGYRKMAVRVIDSVLKNMSSKQKDKLKKSATENIALVNPSLENSKGVNIYIKELEQVLATRGMNDPYYAWYLCTTFGKKADTIIDKMSFFIDATPEENLIRAELWYCIHHEMTNSLADFFVRRTGRLYFNIESVLKYKEIILEDFITYLEWDDKRIASEEKTIQLLLDDATIYYDTEFV